MIEPEYLQSQTYRYKNLTNIKVVLEIPEGYQVKYIPENLKLISERYSVNLNYKQIENKIIYSLDILFDFIELKFEEHKDFNSFLKKINKAYKESIVLIKK